jgi:putative DNA primase/helicase
MTAPDPEAAIAFLEQFHGQAPWQLTAIKPDPDGDRAKDVIHAYPFRHGPKRHAQVEEWITRHNGEGYHLYFSPNPLKRLLHKKASKADVAEAQWLWIDLDPARGSAPERVDAWRAEIFPEFQGDLPDHVPPPTWIIDSGRGVWLLWRLETPSPVDGHGPLTEAIEAYGAAIERAFRGWGHPDSCRNVERIARLPGGVNHRTDRAARVLHHDTDAVYHLGVFPTPELVAPVEPPASADAPRASASADARAPERPTDLPTDLETLVREGVPQGQRSQAFHHTIGWLRDRGWDATQIEGLLARFPTGIAAKYADRTRRRLRKEIQRSFGKTAKSNGPVPNGGAEKVSATTEENPQPIEDLGPQIYPSTHDEIVPIGDRIDLDEGGGDGGGGGDDGGGGGGGDSERGGDRRQRPRPPSQLPSPSRPYVVARIFLEAWCMEGKVRTLHYWRGSWRRWWGSHWVEVEPAVIRALLYAFTSKATYVDSQGEVKAWSPDRRKITDLTDALSALTILSSERDQPSWLDGRDAGVIVSCANGLLDVATRDLEPHTPLYFNATSVPFAFDPKAPPPKAWLAFLDDLWPASKDEQAWKTAQASKNVLGEWFGLIVSGRLDLHKILLMVGPTRGGKGVVARILIALVGEKNAAGPTLSSLGGEFGLAPLVGKTIAVISDVRFVTRESGAIVERLLAISGEDIVSANRKFRDVWVGKIPARLHVISNELPRLGDASMAIVGRIVLLTTTRSWLGNEDHGLETRLRGELTGIFNWSLDGLQRLTVTNKNQFTRIEIADEAINTMRDLASPARAFVRERCVLGPDEQAECDGLYKSFREWCDDAGLPKPAKHVFGRDLRAAFPSIKVMRPRGADGKPGPRAYVGVKFKGVGAEEAQSKEEAE